MFRLLWLNIILFFITVYGQISSDQAQSSSCGSNSIPYDFRVDANGLPEISCSPAAPCFGTINQDPIEDGDDTYAYGNRYQRHVVHEGKSAVAECSGKLSEQVCSSMNEWTSVIQEYNNGTHFILKAECCSFDGLSNATIASNTYSIKNGEHFTGGGVLDDNGKLIAFDLIKQVRKSLDQNNEAVYHVTINRITCSSNPKEEYKKQISSSSEDDPVYDSEESSYGYRQKDFADDMYMPSSYSNSNNRRHHRLHRAPLPRRSYPPRQRHYYRPVFDEYDYYDSEPTPRRPYHRQYRSRYEPEQYYHPNERAPAYGYKNFEPMEEYQGTTNLQPYQFNRNPEPKRFIQQLHSQPSHAGIMPLAPPQQPLTNLFQPLTLFPPLQLPQINPHPASQSPLPPAKAFASQTLALNDQPNPQQFSSDQSLLSSQQQYPGGFDQSAGGTSSSSYYSGQQQQPSYSSSSDYSSSGGCGGGDLNCAMSSMQCFSGDMTVQTPSGFKRMDELEVGDMILSVEQSMISFTPVIMFLHNDPEEVATFIEIETADNQKLKLTEFHLIYVTNCEPGPYKLIHAKDVKVGHCLEIVAETQQSLKSVEVIAIREIEQVGIYAPLTASGDLMVNSVYASCHSNMGIQTLQQTFFAFYRKINVGITAVLNMLGINSTAAKASNGLPFGVKYLTSVLDVIVPKTFLS